MGLTSIVGGLVSSATEYATAASKQLQSMQTLFPSNELDKKLNDALSNDPTMPGCARGQHRHRQETRRYRRIFRTSDMLEVVVLDKKLNDALSNDPTMPGCAHVLSGGSGGGGRWLSP